MIEFRLDGGVDTGEQKTEDAWQGEGTAAGEVLWVEAGRVHELS